MPGKFTDRTRIVSRRIKESIAETSLDWSNVILTRAKPNVPVLTGRFRDSLEIYGQEIDDDRITTSFGSKLPYALSLELPHSVIGDLAGLEERERTDPENTGRRGVITEIVDEFLPEYERMIKDNARR